MNKKIFKGIFLVSILAILVTLAFIISILTNYFDKQIENELKSETRCIAIGMNQSKDDYIGELSQMNLEGNRITWINDDGTVLYDSVKNASEMENHKDRLEVREALSSGTGESMRYSSSLSKRTIYYAMMLDDGTVLRLSSSQHSIFIIMMGLIQPIIVIIVIGAVLSAVLSNLIAKKIVKPINDIDLDNPDIDEQYDELTPLIKKIRNQNETIASQVEELTRKQREFGIITENMSEAFIIVDNQAEILSYNPAVLKMFDIKKAVNLKNAYMINRSEEFISTIQKALEGRHSEQEIEINDTSLLVIANPVLRNNMVDGAIIVLMDITEKQMREQMRREFTSNVSHELKTPLTSIYGVADMLASGIVKPEDVSKFAKDICDESKRMINLINDIIRLSQLDEELPVQEEKKDIDLFVVSKVVAKRLSGEAEKKNVEIIVNGEENKAVVYGVETMLEEVIYNLCDNAIKYNKENGRVEITTAREADKVTIVVNDTGIGIPKNHVNRIFERFYRVDKSHSRKIGGTGLGLSIVKHAVNFHDGKIAVESKEGKGTKITIAFDV